MALKLHLKKRPRRPVIIEGFPGFGIVGGISTQYIIDHLNMELIGSFFSEKVPAVVAVHNKKMVPPIGIYYSQEHNLLVVHPVITFPGLEWSFSTALLKLAKELKAREIISIEGVTSFSEEVKTYYYTNSEKLKERLNALNLEEFKEGIIVGPTATLLATAENFPVVCIFAETSIEPQDARSAAKALEVLDKYLNLGIDTKPLLKEAGKFEKHLKQIIKQSLEAMDVKKKKELSYVG
ncbi:proteasome assembly chaperone family protein [Candidatus Woesearchaeota archaeon]|nr:proteasome assembly chaperone family protein [Candidatus Woesearchaeota archaeon]